MNPGASAPVSAVVYAASAAAAANVIGVLLTIPPGHTGKTALLHFGQLGSSITWTAPVGWTQISPNPNFGAIFKRVLDGSETTVTNPEPAAVASVGIYSGVVTTTLFGPDTANNTPQTFPVPGLIPAGGALVMMASAQVNSAWSSPSVGAIRIQAGTSTGIARRVILADYLPSTANDPGTPTVVSPGVSSAGLCKWSVLLA